MKKKVYLLSLGCAKNLVDSEVMLGYLLQAGYQFVAEPSQADIILINTCGFIEPARQEARQAIQEAISLKHHHPHLQLAVVGCYVERDRDTLLQEFPEIDILSGVRDFDRIVELLEGRDFQPGRETFLYSHESPRALTTPPAWAYVKISEGCSHQCGFCSIPLIKGPYRSRPVDSIITEIKMLEAQGVLEINLISHDTTYYGRDLGLQQGLIHLLEEILGQTSLPWIRVLYGYPEEVTAELIDLFREKRICSYFDLPFQHAHPRIIKAMRRGLDGTRALRLIEEIRSKLPEVALRTSLIVGFPGETPAEFSTLVDFVARAEFDHLGVFLYSPEKNTPNFSLGDPVPSAEKERRRAEIMQLQAEISHRRNRRFLGQRLEVLVEESSDQTPQFLLGRTQYQAPEVDGVVYLQPCHQKYINSLRQVVITSTDVYDLKGKIVP